MTLLRSSPRSDCELLAVQAAQGCLEWILNRKSDDKDANMEDLFYNGSQLRWHGKGAFKATSGTPDLQQPKHQCVKEYGPVPEGNYYVALLAGGAAEDDGTGRCQLRPSWQIQTIPRGQAAGTCEQYWSAWGSNRVRFEAADGATKAKCAPVRGGFYLHDSIKGYSHGCIEVEGTFFSVLRGYVSSTKNRNLRLRITYAGVNSTYGGTYVP